MSRNFRFLFTTIVILVSCFYIISRKSPEDILPTNPCSQFLRSLPRPPLSKTGDVLDIYLIDTIAISELLKNCSANLDLPLAVMVSEVHSDALIDSSLYNVTFFEDKGDFLLLKTEPQRVLLKQDYQRIGPLLVPMDMRMFIEFYERSRLIPCLNKSMNRSEADSKQKLPANFENDLADLRDALIDMGTMPYLTDGTLLGWYRECSFIPHTHDADLAVSRAEYRPDMTERLQSLSGYRLYRRLGRVFDSLEFTLHPKRGGSIDIFIAYDQDDDRVYTHGLDLPTGTRVKWIVPRPKGFCSGILRGKIFFVTCNIEETIMATYGLTWGSDHPTSRFNWMKSSNNAVEFGNFTKEEMKKYYIVY